jgi:putative restriction endonuclease
MTICVYPTDRDWINSLADSQKRDNVNFWRKDVRNLSLLPGDIFYFKIRGGLTIAGRGYFREQRTLSIQDAWSRFRLGNGVANLAELEQRAKAVLQVEGNRVNCLVLDGVEILSDAQRPQIEESDFPRNIMGAKFFQDDEIPYIASAFSASTTPSILLSGEAAAQFQQDFDPENISTSRSAALRAICARRGQTAFRAMLLSAYKGKCAVTGEGTEETLEAAHIHPYLGEDTNTIQNGFLLRSDWHTLFDLGLWTIADDYTIQIGSKLRSPAYRDYSGRPLLLPTHTSHRPSKPALKFHREKIFRQ